MEVQSPPYKILRTGEQDKAAVGHGKRFELEQDRGGSKTHSCGFTFMQLQELELQALIYKYIEAGYPIPNQLLMPIWKSVAASLSFQHYPNWLGYNLMYHEHRTNMEPEPGRCRRTDGKKWRCSKEVIAGHRYCEKHVNRGRHRSRKHVEVNSPAPTMIAGNTKELDFYSSDDTNLSISVKTSSSSISSTR